MNQQTEQALLMAIEALEYEEFCSDFLRVEAINACKAALEQPTKPLSNDEIRNCLYDCKTQDFLQFARSIEKAHGIGVKDE